MWQLTCARQPEATATASTRQHPACCRLTEAIARTGILSVPPDAYGELRGNFTDVLAAMAPDRSFFAEVTAQHPSRSCSHRGPAGLSPRCQQTSARCCRATGISGPLLSLVPCARMEGQY